MSTQQKRPGADTERLAIVATKALPQNMPALVRSNSSIATCDASFNLNATAPHATDSNLPETIDKSANNCNLQSLKSGGLTARKASLSTVSVGAFAQLPDFNQTPVIPQKLAQLPRQISMTGKDGKKLTVQDMNPFGPAGVELETTTENDTATKPTSQPAPANLYINNLDASRVLDSFSMQDQPMSKGLSSKILSAKSNSSVNVQQNSNQSLIQSKVLSASRSRMSSLPPLDSSLICSTSSMNLRQTADTQSQDICITDSINLSHSILDQPGTTIAHVPTPPTSGPQMQRSRHKSNQDLGASAGSLNNSNAPPPKPSPLLRNRSFSGRKVTPVGTAEAVAVKQAVASPTKPVLPKIGAGAPKIQPTKNQQAQEAPIVVEEKPVLSARELAKQRALEKTIWRFSKMDETKLSIYMKNKLRAKELAERTRMELLRKLRKNCDDSDEEEEPMPIPSSPKRPQTATRMQMEIMSQYDRYISNIDSGSGNAPMQGLRSTFVHDFVTMEHRAIQEFENYWDMRVRDVNVIPKHLIKPFSVEETMNMAWNMYCYLRSVKQPLFHVDLGRMMLLITETEWSTTDKLFEMQKLFAKLPKEIFLVLKCVLTHLCRLSVSSKTEPYHFRALSNIFAPLIFRIPSRQNSIYQEQLYLAEHPSVLQYSDDSLDAEFESTINSDFDDDKGANMADFAGEDAGERVTSALYSMNNEQSADPKAPDPAMTAKSAPHSNTPSIAHSNYSRITTQTKATTRMTGGRAPGSIHIPRSIITSKYSGTRASQGPQVDNLWDNAQDEAPSIREIAASPIPGFKTEAVVRERQVYMPDLENIEIPKGSPFSKEALEIAAAVNEELDEEFEFDDWVLKQMQEAAQAYKSKKSRPAQVTAEALPNQLEEGTPPSNMEGKLPSTVEILAVPPTSEPEDLTVPASDNPNAVQQEETQSVPQIQKPIIDLQDESDEFEYAGIRIEICEFLEADMYIARTVTDKPTTDGEMASLLAVLESPMHAMFASNQFEIDRLPMVVHHGATVTDVEVVVPENPNNIEPEFKLPKRATFCEMDFGESDPDGFGWNLMTKKGLATELYIAHECQTALSSALELIIKNLDVLFDYNTHIVAERSAKMAVLARRGSSNLL
ncbi:hypothetical protein BJ741DRAFT_705129 [Chytriomyces cf. hyalinus JEL632]|nr:hypothetical protein BJ741DRAFT_705129 [Chytriomyces cf. hyalinus JEL632]